MLLKRESNDTTGTESIHNLSCNPTGFLFVGLSFARVSQNWNEQGLLTGSSQLGPVWVCHWA